MTTEKKAHETAEDDLPPAPLPAPLPAEGQSEKAEQAITSTDEDVYNRFKPRQKTMITALASYNAFLSPMTASIFLPSIPNVAADLSTTPVIINVTVALFIITIGTAPLIWSPMSGFYGRRPIYLASMPIMLVSSIGVANSSSVGSLIATRILQGIGSSAALAVGAGCIGDVFKPTERANAIGWFYSGAVLGPSLSPLIGAAFTQYTQASWRSAQYFLGGCAALSFILTYFFLPETMHAPIPHRVLCEERGKRFVPFFFNPLAILGLFGWLNIVAISFISSSVLMLAYVILVPVAVAFGDQYGISDIMIIGCIYLASGAGNIVGSRIAGQAMADSTVQKYIRKRGYRRPEDRLRAAIWGLGLIMPVSAVAYGWLLQTSAGGLAPPIVFLFLNGFGVMCVFTPINTYAVDCMQERSASVIAINNWTRYLWSAAASAFVLPMANKIGWGWSLTLVACIVWLSFGVLLLTIRYGHHWRERANKRYGYNTMAEDERHPPSIRGTDEEVKEEEVGVSAEDDTHTDLPQRPIGVRGSSKLERKGSEKLSRERSRGALPDAESMLKRTESITASIHG